MLLTLQSPVLTTSTSCRIRPSPSDPGGCAAAVDGSVKFGLKSGGRDGGDCASGLSSGGGDDVADLNRVWLTPGLTIWTATETSSSSAFDASHILFCTVLAISANVSSATGSCEVMAC